MGRNEEVAPGMPHATESCTEVTVWLGRGEAMNSDWLVPASPPSSLVTLAGLLRPLPRVLLFFLHHRAQRVRPQCTQEAEHWALSPGSPWHMRPLGWPEPGPASSLSKTWKFGIIVPWPHHSQHPRIHYFPRHCDLKPTKRELRERGCVPSHGAEGCCPSQQQRHSYRDSFVPGTTQETRRECPCLNVVPPFYSVRDPSPSSGAAHMLGVSSLLSYASREGAREMVQWLYCRRPLSKLWVQS